MKPTIHTSASRLPDGHPLKSLGMRFEAEEAAAAAKPKVQLQPADLDVARNPLRPTTLDEMVGQSRLKPLLRRLIESAQQSGRPLDHLLLVGASGTGKSTTAMVVARELGARVFMLKAPLATDVLVALQESAQDGDVVFVDEVHLQVSGDRRGITQACDPEAFYSLLEDGILATPEGPTPFPHVTWIGATTDVGLLPEALSNRFPLQPRLAPYTTAEMTVIAKRNAQRLALRLAPGVAEMFAGACRLNPRQLNSYMRSARSLGRGHVTLELAREVIQDLCSTTLDGLTDSMQTVLRFLYRNCRRESKAGVTFSASVNTLATAAGHGRDTKAISLLTEPWLLQQGFLEVRPTGRTLTPLGIERAVDLCAGTDLYRVPIHETAAARALRDVRGAQ